MTYVVWNKVENANCGAHVAFLLLPTINKSHTTEHDCPSNKEEGKWHTLAWGAGIA